MYSRTFWQNHVVDQSGTVIQQGTMQDQEHFNNEEVGIEDGAIAAAIFFSGFLQKQRANEDSISDLEGRASDLEDRADNLEDDVAGLDGRADTLEGKVSDLEDEVLGETHTVTLTNSAKYPFNSSVDTPVTVPLTTTRMNLYYTIETEVSAHTGEVGDVIISDKALNGFKVSFDGPGTGVTVILRIKGGMA